MLKITKGKKVVAAALIVALVMGIGYNTCKITSKANELLDDAQYEYDDIIHEMDNSDINLLTNYDKDNMLCKKLEHDRDNDVTDLNPDVEKRLNELGVFDIEINRLDEKTFEKLEKSEQINVNIDYIKTEPNSKMTFDEINDVIEYGIENGTIDYSAQESDVLSSALEIIGLKPITAYAKGKEKTAEDVSSSGAMKHVVIASQMDKGEPIDVFYQATWLKQAKCRRTDVIVVNVKGTTINNKTWSCKHSAEHYLVGRLSEVKTTHPDAFIVSDARKGIACKVDLFGSDSKHFQVGEKYEDEYIFLSFECEPVSASTTCHFTSHYFHTVKSTDLSPSVSFNGESVSVSLGTGGSSAIEEITNNVDLDYNCIK